ncbi:MAG: homocysteine S-methyltransferase family protein [Deltaproteobacteria bacterium]|nr:homocysteine S-methyltransferase family protein [Deltaproteobacteria bacterium]
MRVANTVASVERMKILDGPMGTELAARGVATPAPGWSAYALDEAKDVVAAIHADYARAGAGIHRGNTFRTQAHLFPDRYVAMAKSACDLARAGIRRVVAPSFARPKVAGSLAPVMDCYRPDLSPPPDVARKEHRANAAALERAGFELIVCEAFPHHGEAVIAVEEAIETGLEVWIAFTAGPEADLMTTAAMRDAARDCVEAGATAVMVNCTAATRTLAYVEALSDAGVAFGAYANAGPEADGLGWGADREEAAARYADLAEAWVARGATIVGSCCGTSPAHVAELVRRFGPAR